MIFLDKRNFIKFIQTITQKGALPITNEGAKFSKVNGYAVYTNYKEGDPRIKTASVFFQGKRGKATLTLYSGPVRRSLGDDGKVIKNTFNVVDAPGSIVTQIKSTIENWLN